MAEKKDQVAKAPATDKKPAAKPAAEKAIKAPAAQKTAKPAAEKTVKPAEKAVEKAAKPAAQKAPAKSYKKETNPERNRLKQRYYSEVVPSLMKEKGYKNIFEVPKLDKIILNMRLGDIKDNSKSIKLAQTELESICGQRCVIVKAKKSVANFKLRENQPIGIKTTLRGDRMYEFFDKLVSVALPRVRDFRGVSPKSFDGRGNYATGVKEQIIFPEISYEQVEKVRGFDICVVTSAKSDAEAQALLLKMGMPFKNN